MQIYKARKSKQSLGAAVLSKTSSSSVTGCGTPGKYVECSESRRWRGRLFHRRGPATVNERSTRLVRVLGTSHVATLDGGSCRRSASSAEVAVAGQSSAKYYGDRPFISSTSTKLICGFAHKHQTNLRVRAQAPNEYAGSSINGFKHNGHTDSST